MVVIGNPSDQRQRDVVRIVDLARREHDFIADELHDAATALRDLLGRERLELRYGLARGERRFVGHLRRANEITERNRHGPLHRPDAVIRRHEPQTLASLVHQQRRHGADQPTQEHAHGFPDLVRLGARQIGDLSERLRQQRHRGFHHVASTRADCSCHVLEDFPADERFSIGRDPEQLDVRGIEGHAVIWVRESQRTPDAPDVTLVTTDRGRDVRSGQRRRLQEHLSLDRLAFAA
jgi:hypothetical protein